MKTKKIKVDLITSLLINVPLGYMVEIAEKIQGQHGEVIAFKVIEVDTKYNKLESADGNIDTIKKGEIILSALGDRKALEGIVGIVPEKIIVDEILNILNIGGVIGKATSWNKQVVESPSKVQILGAVIKHGKGININQFSLPLEFQLAKSAPIVAVFGTGMNSGKTTVTTKLISYLNSKGLKVAAAKFTGVAAQKDLIAMKAAGANPVLSFLDAGLVSTVSEKFKVIPSTKTILNSLNKSNPDLIITEMGDGIAGWYGVDLILHDKEILSNIKFNIVCAHDLVGAVGATSIFEKLNLKIDLFAGPVTNTSAGIDFLEKFLQIPALNIKEYQAKVLQSLEMKGFYL